MGARAQWFLLTCLGFCAAWMDDRPVLESRDGNLFISAAKDRNITLKVLGDGYVNVNKINLLHVATAAESATRLIERWKTGYLAEVESNVQRLTQIVEGPDGLEKRINMMRGFGDGNTTLPPGIWSRNDSTMMSFKIRMLNQRVRRVEEKVKSIELKLTYNECLSNPCLNGGTCQDLYEGYQCHCPSNWEGPNCVVDVNECVRLLGTDLGCQNGATCHNLPGSYRCDCAPGWFGLHCTAKTSVCNTESSNELCGHGVCVPKVGSPLGYTCICDQGWQADGTNPACIKDVDECAGNHRPCSVNPWVECRNAPGTFFCDSCPRGYTGNGYYCTDIDECQENNGGCSTSPRVQCINTMGSSTCGTCPTGYRGDGVTCTYVGSCAINNGGCHPLATCVENPGLTSAYVICRCPLGMVGLGTGPNGCRPSTLPSVTSPCSRNPCVHGRCVVVENGYECLCNSGYTGATCNIKTDPCVPNPCKNNGVCLISNGAITCDCPTSHTGSRCETLRQTCGGVSRNPVGHLKFPSGGNVYQHGLSCAWVLVTNSSLVLNVTFTSFNLEESTDCKYDFLQIHDGRNAGSQMIGRFCGKTLPHGNGNIVSSHNSLYFWFHSDNSISHDGFMFRWNSTTPVCGGTLRDDYGTISSPGSPGRYPPNRDCYWQISVKPSKRIQIHFGQLMLEEHPTCEADFLEITTIHNKRLGLYCNHSHPAPLIVPSSQAIIYFHSDSAGQDAGFQIHYSAIEGRPGCNGVYTSTADTITSPPNIANLKDIECEWKIQIPLGERIEITWSKFELKDRKCDNERVEVYDGETSESPLIGRYCGNTIPPTIVSKSNVVLIIFNSRLYQKGSFSLSYTIMCGGVYTEETGLIQSPMYPQLEEHTSLHCTYKIKQPPSKRIMLRILDVHIVNTLKYNLLLSQCYEENLRVYDGANKNATRLANLCGQNRVTETDLVTYYSTHNFMLLEFNLDNLSRGRFSANYTTIANRCGGIYTDLAGSIQTNSENGYYANNEHCIWTIQAPIGYVVQLNWLSFQLEQNLYCRTDYVKVYENYKLPDQDVIGTFCGSKIPPMLMTQKNSMTLVFNSDSTVTHEGFAATYILINATKICGGHFVKPSGVIQSPNYPQRYPSRKECTWTIQAPNKRRIVLNVTHFELERHTNCFFDYLEIRNGGYGTSPLIGKFCGTNIPTEIISQTNQLYLKFSSDSTRSFSGFSIDWDSTTTGCGGVLTTAHGDIMSPNYPHDYSHLEDCTWKIAVAAGNLVRLLIVDLQLENSHNCRFDYIEITDGPNRMNSQTYCNAPYPKVIVSKTNIMNIRFRSDYTTFARGFHLTYETLCVNKIQGFNGVIESPNFPANYEHNLNCSWTIDAPMGNKINLTFSHFDLEGTGIENECKYDYLEVLESEDDSDRKQLAKLCSSTGLPSKIHSTDHRVIVNFVTDSLLAFRGFRLEWIVDGCGGRLTRPFDTFTSPGYPSPYPSNIDCHWLIEVDYMHSIELTLHEINTERQKGCIFDRLQIYGGENDEAPLLVELCYSPKPVVYTSFGNKMFLRFHSDSGYAATGFNASYKMVPLTCGGKYTADTGVIFSANYPKNYPNKQNCEWLLQVDQHYVVNITFLDFDLEDTRQCTDDYVRIYDGPTRDSPLLGSHCRNQLPPSYVSTSNEMLIVMRTDSALSAKGFKAKYSKACGARIIVEDPGFLAPSVGYSGDSFESTNCTWILIAKDPADHVTITFTQLVTDLETYVWTDNCLWNYVQVFEGEGLNGPIRGKWCDNVVPLPVTSNGNALTVHLYSDEDYLGHFALTYTTLNSACGGTYNSSEGTIASPGYPNSYPLNSECVWILNTSPGSKIQLTFAEFELQQSENCDLDYLEVREDNGAGNLLGTFCGTTFERVETFKNLWIKFKSDGVDVGKGFKASFEIATTNDITGHAGRITSPLYPIPYKHRNPVKWRITVDFGWVIRIQITDLFIENFFTWCSSSLTVYDGYDDEAPVLAEICQETSEPITTTSNVAFISFTSNILRQGSVFDLNWLQVPRDVDDPFSGNSEIELDNCTEEIGLMSLQNASYKFTSPGWPNGYDSDLHCTWVFTSPAGTHLVLKILAIDLEESSDCMFDSITVYSGNALVESNNAPLLNRFCLSNATSVQTEADSVMTVKFNTDRSVNRTGFNAYVYRECGGKMSGPNGVINFSNITQVRGTRISDPLGEFVCVWVVEVRPGRTIEVKITKMSIVQGPQWTCTNHYLMLKNGGEETSPFLGAGKYCDNVIPAPLQTTGNRLYVKVRGIESNTSFQLSYREVGTDCGGEFVLSDRQKEWEIKTPNYPNIPHPYSECTWTVLAPNREKIAIDFIERFDLSDTPSCVREYVEIRDGGTDSSKLIGRYCKDVAPSTITTTGNMLHVHFYTELAEPKNGFKARIYIGNDCGGIIRGTNGTITSPNYPFSAAKNLTCEWQVIAPPYHSLEFSFLDIHLPGFRRCRSSGYVRISEKLQNHGFDEVNSLGTFCGFELPDTTYTASNEAIVTFQSDTLEFMTYRGFNVRYVASKDTCGGDYTAMSGTIKSYGYPNVAAHSGYCVWRITLPKSFHVVVEIQDIDTINDMAHSIEFFNDFHFLSRIKIVYQNSTVRHLFSSGNTMMIDYQSAIGHRGFKLRYHSRAPAPCGGVLRNVKGSVRAPTAPPFNESSFYCVWSVEAPQISLASNETVTGLTLTIAVTGLVSRRSASITSNVCFTTQYISITDVGMICGNFSEPVYLRSPLLVNELIIMNKTNGSPMNFSLDYEWQPCGGVLTGPSHVVRAPKNISFPISCAWKVKYPQITDVIRLRFNRLHLGSCDKNYITIRNGGYYAPNIGKFCGDLQPPNITSSHNLLWIEYTASEAPDDFEFVIESVETGCGGVLRGISREISSPKFPKQYPNNAECAWEITATNGYHVGLTFIDRFNLETSPNCEKDYVEAFNWVQDGLESSKGSWVSLGKVCGRNTPAPFNSTSNRMKVVFRSNEAIQGDGFHAVWSENCGGIFEVTSRPKTIASPAYPHFYRTNLFCNYTLVAPEKQILVEFTEFQLENGNKDCKYDNLTIVYEDRYSKETIVACGSNKPTPIKSRDQVEIIFMTDSHIQEQGFVFKYYISECGGVITAPGEIKPLLQGEKYFGDMNCVWQIRAPADKNVVLRFESFELESSYRCYYDYVKVYNSLEENETNVIATLCGDLEQHLPALRSNSSTMMVQFHADYTRNYRGFVAKVIFVKSSLDGCGGNVNLTNSQRQAFRTQKESTYESLEECHWDVITDIGKQIKLTIDSMDLKNATNRTVANNECSGDYIEIRDGFGPFADLIGKYCGNQPPAVPILSSSNSLWIRFVSDGTLEGAGVIGTLEVVNSLCGIAPLIVNTTRHQLSSPNYPNRYEPNAKCRWTLKASDTFGASVDRLKIHFLSFDLADSSKCETDYVQITDMSARSYVETDAENRLIWHGNMNEMVTFVPSASYRYCGGDLPHDFYSISTEIEVTFKGTSTGHTGFKFEYGVASCDRNYTSEQGRIVHESIEDCWITITVPANSTISLYFNQFGLYDPEDCTKSSLKASDGDFNGKLVASLCSLGLPSPIFSTGNKLSLHSWSEYHNSYDYYDLTYTSTTAGRGCGGRIFNYAGSFTSPLYPNEYRKNAECIWDINVPLGMKVALNFVVFDLGKKSSCNYMYDVVEFYDVTSDGDEIMATSYCGGDRPATFVSSSSKVIVKYISSMNNVGTGWTIEFNAREE
ncbi:cubilin [Xylocopa sonorina]|uniref:cubilin n=1 Tax=Xylocopa sonorina TaxID=1818115 RepID=UPI00403A86AB